MELFIDAKKKSLFSNEEKKFNDHYNREELQKKIDIDIFSKSTSIDRVLQYLEKPDLIIEEKQNQMYEETWERVKFNFQKHNFASKLAKDLCSKFRELQENLENVSKIR